MNELAKKAFATHYHYLLKAQNFHWNVTGPDFLELHELFGSIYEELEEHTDEFAEALRGLGCVVPGTFKELTELSVINDPILPLAKDDMLAYLYKDNVKIVRCLLDAYTSAEEAGEHGFSSLLANRLSEHKKHGWKLYSTMYI